MSELLLRFPCGKLRLEGRWHVPDKQGQFPAVIVCHPHPLYGGNMFNNIVTAICDALVLCSMAALRFNFRGVGASEGEFGGGVGEIDDVRAALDTVAVEPAVDKTMVGLVGYSFGANVAMGEAAHDDRVKALALVSPPLLDVAFRKFSKPKFLIAGENDDYLQSASLEAFVKGLPEGQVRIVPSADHFWWGQEDKVGDEVADFFTKAFKR